MTSRNSFFLCLLACLHHEQIPPYRCAVRGTLVSAARANGMKVMNTSFVFVAVVWIEFMRDFLRYMNWGKSSYEAVSLLQLKTERWLTMCVLVKLSLHQSHAVCV